MIRFVQIYREPLSAPGFESVESVLPRILVTEHGNVMALRRDDGAPPQPRLEHVLAWCRNADADPVTLLRLEGERALARELLRNALQLAENADLASGDHVRTVHDRIGCDEPPDPATSPGDLLQRALTAAARVLADAWAAEVGTATHAPNTFREILARRYENAAHCLNQRIPAYITHMSLPWSAHHITHDATRDGHTSCLVIADLDEARFDDPSS